MCVGLNNKNNNNNKKYCNNDNVITLALSHCDQNNQFSFDDDIKLANVTMLMPSLYTKGHYCAYVILALSSLVLCICTHMGLYRQVFTGLVLQIIFCSTFQHCQGNHVGRTTKPVMV